jgi:hypothetical protein
MVQGAIVKYYLFRYAPQSPPPILHASHDASGLAHFDSDLSQDTTELPQVHAPLYEHLHALPGGAGHEIEQPPG